MKIKDNLYKETDAVQYRIQEVLALQHSNQRAQFRHYKGALYCFAGFSTDEETLRIRVEYLPQEAEPDEIPWSRTAERFFGRVVGEDGMSMDRFALIP